MSESTTRNFLKDPYDILTSRLAEALVVVWDRLGLARVDQFLAADVRLRGGAYRTRQTGSGLQQLAPRHSLLQCKISGVQSFPRTGLGLLAGIAAKFVLPQRRHGQVVD